MEDEDILNAEEQMAMKEANYDYLKDEVHILYEENKRLNNIIKEVRELLNQEWYSVLRKETITKVKEILDKGENND